VILLVATISVFVLLSPYNPFQNNSSASSSHHQPDKRMSNLQQQVQNKSLEAAQIRASLNAKLTEELKKELQIRKELEMERQRVAKLENELKTEHQAKTSIDEKLADAERRAAIEKKQREDIASQLDTVTKEKTNALNEVNSERQAKETERQAKEAAKATAAQLQTELEDTKKRMASLRRQSQETGCSPNGSFANEVRW
jgi:chromosome segregation ATPase